MLKCFKSLVNLRFHSFCVSSQLLKREISLMTYLGNVDPEREKEKIAADLLKFMEVSKKSVLVKNITTLSRTFPSLENKEFEEKLANFLLCNKEEISF